MDILTDKISTKLTFEENIKTLSVSYQRNTKIAINHFMEFCKKECSSRTIVETFDFLKKLKNDDKETKLYHLLQLWINDLAKTRDSTTVRNYFAIVKKYARHHSIKISIEDVKDNLTFPKKMKERKYIMTLDDVSLIIGNSSYKKKAFYLFMLSTGLRPKEAMCIRKRHVKMLNGRYMITVPAEATKLKVEREAFTSTECFSPLTRILRNLKDNDYLWTKQENKIHAVTSAGLAFRKCCDRIGLTQKYEHVNRFKLNLYCFRAYYYTQASKRHGDEYAHKMIGHSGYLAVYDRKTIDEKLSMYADFENDLMSDQTIKHKAKIAELEEKTKRIDDLERRVQNQDKDFALRVKAIYENMEKDRKKSLAKSPELIKKDFLLQKLKKAQKDVKIFNEQLED